MNKIIPALSITLLLAFAACQPAAKDTPPPLAGATMGGAFALVDQDEQPVTDRSFPDKYRLVYFGYTYCPDVCPVDVAAIGSGLTQFERTNRVLGAKVQPLFITVDPKRDTPAVLKAFVANFHPRMVGLTGTEAQISDIARRYAVIFERQKPNETGAYLVDHSRTAVLYDPDGHPIALIPQDQGPKAVAAELARWVK